MSDDAAREASVLEAVVRATTTDPQPILLSGGAVVSRNPLMGDWEQADVLLGGSRVVGVGPGLLPAAGDDGMLVVDVSGCLVLPARPDFTAAPGRGEGTLTSGVAADLAVVRIADRAALPAGPVVNRPSLLDIVVVGGRVTVWDGQSVAGTEGTQPPVVADAEHGYAGMWIDDTGFLHQELLPDGRYDETRGGRPHAYQGRYWITGDHIEYLDDLGFWAYGEFRDGVLHHGGYRLTRS
ncbi:Atu4866 domain-containing protein [Auraticoccus monumenti]|uniref:Protein Atu4866 n=1 Tax=Auraticoccus monumenti TaxID=675864 RepID=A0A1G6Z3G0_9ACTN|nr:Atu4866 domain-containing protein [Auraticoccus monumenti]SDD97071.1 protein Atu4866 [Auraticoccus monumenti]